MEDLYEERHRGIKSDYYLALDMFFRFVSWEAYYDNLRNNKSFLMDSNSLIRGYLEAFKQNYDEMMSEFRTKYIDGEANEINDEQKEGLRLVYDYIQNYPADPEGFNALISALEINFNLWKPTRMMPAKQIEEFFNRQKRRMEEISNVRFSKDNDPKLDELIDRGANIGELLAYAYEKANEADKRPVDMSREYEKTTSMYAQQLREARRASEERNWMNIGGRFREGAEGVLNSSLNLDVPNGFEAIDFMNTFCDTDKKVEFIDYYNNNNIIEYIQYCIRATLQMLRYQPFVAGNETTFISLLNLMFKMRGIPPIFIQEDEQKAWKEALYKAVKDEKNADYADLYEFYNYKILRSIYELDLKPFWEKREKGREAHV